MLLLIIAVILILLSSGLALAGVRLPRVGRWALLPGLAGAGLGLLAVVLCLLNPASGQLEAAWPTIGGWFRLTLDPLAAIFLLPLFLIFGAGQLYGIGYRHHNAAWINIFYPLLATGMVLLFTAGNGVLFLIGWEIMALAGFLLVLTERDDDEVFKAGFLYLTLTHTGTLALFGMFALLGEAVCLQRFPEVGSLSGAAGTAIFLLALFGFGCKAGIMPLHIWLPRAHAAAPSQVSALMSGVVIKSGIYGLLRIISFYHDLPPWWGWLILVLGLVSGVMGVVFALAQNDLKRMLAYSSVENIGIIMIGIGAGLLGVSYGLAELAVLGLAGGLLHVINHGLFKALLFLSGGAVVRATGTREMAAWGGLLQAMPLSGMFFLAGALAVCGLPPLNGFVSEWLIYLGLFRGGLVAHGIVGLLPVVVGLALIGGLALLAFTKVFGLCFLGESRPQSRGIVESPRLMLSAMAILLAACLLLGLAPQMVMPLLASGVGRITGTSAGVAGLVDLAPVGYLSLGVLLLILLVGLLLLGRARRGAAPPRVSTWGCGYALALPRARYSPASFAAMVKALFYWALHSRQSEEKPRVIFPVQASLKIYTPDPVLDLCLLPMVDFLGAMTVRWRRPIHQGVQGISLLYLSLMLCLLLSYAMFWH
jgi:hydrogenase-4 component B